MSRTFIASQHQLVVGALVKYKYISFKKARKKERKEGSKGETAAGSSTGICAVID